MTDAQATERSLFKPSERFRLDADSPVPLYHQMEQIILDRIARDKAVGWMLPREMDLIDIFGVSRATVKKATDGLAAKGMIERKRAVGTRIVKVNVTEDLGRLTSYTEQMEKAGLEIRTELLKVATHLPEPDVARRLKLRSGQKTLCIRRLRGTDDEFPIVLLRSEIPTRFGIREDERFDDSLYRVIEERYRIPIEWAEQDIRAEAADAETAKLLGIKPGSGVLTMERVTFTTGDQPLEFVRAIYRPEFYTFSVRLKR